MGASAQPAGSAACGRSLSGRAAAGGGRHVDVEPERLTKWLAGFTERHGTVVVRATATTVLVTAADGALAECEVPFPPLIIDDSAYAGLVAHAVRPRRIGVVLVRLGGYAVGVFDGVALVSSKVGSRQVHGRSAAGGWSQHRFARRREGQVRVALGDAADIAARILLPVAPTLEAIVLGGDSKAVAAVMDDARFATLGPLVQPRVLDVPDPKLGVLTDSPRLFRAVRIRVVDPAPDPATRPSD